MLPVSVCVSDLEFATMEMTCVLPHVREGQQIRQRVHIANIEHALTDKLSFYRQVHRHPIEIKAVPWATLFWSTFP